MALEGDWFANRISGRGGALRRLPKETKTATTSVAGLDQDQLGLSMHRGGADGGWNCKHCSYWNFGDRVACRKCGEEKRGGRKSEREPSRRTGKPPTGRRGQPRSPSTSYMQAAKGERAQRAQNEEAGQKAIEGYISLSQLRRRSGAGENLEAILASPAEEVVQQTPHRHLKVPCAYQAGQQQYVLRCIARWIVYVSCRFTVVKGISLSL